VGFHPPTVSRLASCEQTGLILENLIQAQPSIGAEPASASLHARVGAALA
jgi:hypothetical protein